MSLAVLSVASEAYPLIKTGGLGDVAGALPLALAAEVSPSAARSLVVKAISPITRTASSSTCSGRIADCCLRLRLRGRGRGGASNSNSNSKLPSSS